MSGQVQDDAISDTSDRSNLALSSVRVPDFVSDQRPQKRYKVYIGQRWYTYLISRSVVKSASGFSMVNVNAGPFLTE